MLGRGRFVRGLLLGGWLVRRGLRRRTVCGAVLDHGAPVFLEALELLAFGSLIAHPFVSRLRGLREAFNHVDSVEASSLGGLALLQLAHPGLFDTGLWGRELWGWLRNNPALGYSGELGLLRNRLRVPIGGAGQRLRRRGLHGNPRR